MKITHALLQDCLNKAHQNSVKTLSKKGKWPSSASPQSEWTLLAHFTIAEAMQLIFPPNQLRTMSLRVSTNKKAPNFWAGFQASGAVKDYSTQQQGVDFCLMGPTGRRTHYLTAESECKADDSISVSLSETGYIWDWSKLLSDLSQHRLLFSVVGAGPESKGLGSGNSNARRASLRENMDVFLKGTHPSINFSEGIGGYIIAQQFSEREDSYTFIVNNGGLEFDKIPASILLP